MSTTATTTMTAQSALEVEVQYARIATTYQACLLGVVLWDWMISLRSEYLYIWRARGGSTIGLRILYGITRYLCILLTTIVFVLNYVHLPLDQCNTLVRANCAALVVIQVSAIAVLKHRVWAVLIMSGRWKTYVLALLVALALCTCALGLVHATSGVHAAAEAMMPDTGRGYCEVKVFTEYRLLTAAFFIMPILANIIATATIMYAVSPLPNTNAIKRILVIDGGLYLLGVTTVGVVQLILFCQSRTVEGFKMLNGAALLALTSVFCCRLMLHLRERADEINRFPFGNAASAKDASPSLGYTDSPSLPGSPRSFKKGKIFFIGSSPSSDTSKKISFFLSRSSGSRSLGSGIVHIQGGHSSADVEARAQHDGLAFPMSPVQASPDTRGQSRGANAPVHFVQVVNQHIEAMSGKERDYTEKEDAGTR